MLIEIPNLLQDDYLNVITIQDYLDRITNVLNGQVDDSNIAAGADINAGKIENGGAVTQDELTTSGEASKVPTLDASGNLTILGKLIFFEGLL